VQQDQVLLPQHVDRTIDLVDGAHPGRQDDRFPGRARVSQQVVVGQRRRRDLVTRRGKAIDEIDGLLVPGRREPRDLAGAAVGIDFLVIVIIELESAFQITVGRAKRALARLRQFLRGIDDLDRALLELDRVAAGRHRHADQPLREIDVAVVIDADLSDHIARLGVSDGPIANAHRCRRRL
jgi:hypothetical protein